MTDGFSIAGVELPARASALATAADGLLRLEGLIRPDAGRSTDELAAAVVLLSEESRRLGADLTTMGAALAAAARTYVAADDAIADAFGSW